MTAKQSVIIIPVEIVACALIQAIAELRLSIVVEINRAWPALGGD